MLVFKMLDNLKIKKLPNKSNIIDYNNSSDNILCSDNYYITPLTYYYVSKHPEIVDNIKDNSEIFNKIFYQKNNVITVYIKGYRGSFKSSLARTLALSLKNKYSELNFSIDNICYSNNELKEILQKNKENQILIRDERNAVFGYEQIADNDILTNILEAIRINHNYLIIINPFSNMEFLDYDIEILSYKFNSENFKFLFKLSDNFSYDYCIIKRLKDENLFTDNERKKKLFINTKLENERDMSENTFIDDIIKNIKIELDNTEIQKQDISIYIDKYLYEKNYNLTVHQTELIKRIIRFDNKYNENNEKKQKNKKLTEY